MSLEKLALRACLWAGGGTLLAILANTLFGDRSNLVLASFVGALIGISLGWIVVQEQERLQQESRIDRDAERLFRHKLR